MTRLLYGIPFVLALAGCVTVADPDNVEGPTGACSAQPAQGLIGQIASSETGGKALSLSRATTLRWGPPGAVWTMDYRADRVNVRFDEQNRIIEITCG